MTYPANTRRLLAALLIGLGLLLLILRYFGGFAGSVWPLFVIAPGVALIALATSFDWHSIRVAAAGAVITGAGVILAVQNVSDYYQSWAYAWALLPAFAGAAIWMIGLRQRDASAQATGRGLMQSGGVMFIVLAALFELFIFNHSWFDAGLVMALLLIVLGGVVLFYHNGPTTGAGPGGKVPAGRH